MPPGGLGDSGGRCYKSWSAAPSGRAPTGRRGDNGVAPLGAPIAGSDGAAGMVDATAGTEVEFETVATWGYASLVLRQAELFYLSGKLADAVTLLAWLARVADAGEPGVPIPSRAADLAQAFGTDPNDTLGHIGRRARALLDQMSKGLDYFGQPPGFTQLLRFGRYQQEATALLDHAESVQRFLDGMERATADEQMLRTKLEALVADGKEVRRDLELREDVEAKLLGEIEAEVLRAIAEAAAQEAVLRNTDQGFRDAVARQTGNCSFLEVLTAAAAIVAAAASVYGAVSGGVMALSKAKRAFTSTARTWANDNIVAKHLVTAGKSLKEVQPAWHELKGLVAQEEPHVGKLVMLREDVDKMTEPYLILSEAQQLRAEVSRFLELAQLQNQRILDYTQAVAQHDATLAAIEERVGEAQRITSELAVTHRTLNADNLYAAAARYSFQLRTDVIRFLYQAHLSFQYWSLSSSAFSLASDSIPALRARDGATRVKIVNAFENLRPPRQRMKVPQVVSFTLKDNRDLISRFIATGRFSFTLSPRQVSLWGMRQVYVDEIAVRFAAARTADNVLKAVVTHEGRSGFVASTGEYWEFLHRRLPTSYHYDLRQNVARTDGRIANPDATDSDAGVYWGVGAIGDWSVHLLNATPAEGGDNLELDRSQVTAIEVMFTGRFASPP